MYNQYTIDKLEEEMIVWLLLVLNSSSEGILKFWFWNWSENLGKLSRLHVLKDRIELDF